MKVLVVYDSVFGNTEKVARAIAEAVGAGEVLRAAEVSAERLAELDPASDLLIVGSPTRAFRPTKPTQDLLRRVPVAALDGVAAAAFDTRMDTDEVGSRLLRFLVRIFGYAARVIAAGLTRKGARLVAPPEGFYVGGSEGPLREGELERAAGWAKGLTAPR